MKIGVCVVLVLAIGVVLAPGVTGQWHPDAGAFKQWMDSGNGTALYGNETFAELRHKVLLRVEQWSWDVITHPWKLADVFGKHATEFTENETIILESFEQVQSVSKSAEDGSDFKPLGASKYPYFGFIPNVHGFVIPGAAPISFESQCFSEVTASSKVVSEAGKPLVLEIELSLHKAKSLTCFDHYFLASLDGVMFKNFFFRGTHKFKWHVPAKATEAEVYDVLTRGIRVMQLRDGPLQTLFDIYETVQLFLEPLTHATISEKVSERNLYFLREYTHLKPTMEKRTVNRVDIDESLINSGDFFGIVRLDGLDPMLAWAMGSTTGHTTIALRNPLNSSELYVAESTSKDAYWPTNGVQITPFKQWLTQAEAAGYQVVWAPLSKKYAALFNESSAWEWFQSVEGLDYGYQSMLWAWVDTVSDNYPCLPPDFGLCLQWDHLELLFNWIDLLIPNIGDRLFKDAWNRRLNTTNLSPAQILQKIDQVGITRDEFPSIVEQDGWLYNTTRYGKPAMGEALVCCTFVCNMWKHAGIFAEINDDLNCAEFTNWDAYSLKIFDDEFKTGKNRPSQCVSADPDNELCQLMGTYSLYLNNFNSKTMYDHIAEKCPSKAPDFPRVDDC